jgi:phosphomannomutase
LPKNSLPGAVIGGEDSGHLIFLDHHNTGDGMITALQVLAVMQKEGRPLSELAKIMTVFPQTLINVAVTRKDDPDTIPELTRIIKDVENKKALQVRSNLATLKLEEAKLMDAILLQARGNLAHARRDYLVALVTLDGVMGIMYDPIR